MISPMTLLIAAQRVLTQVRTPLHTDELTRQMLDGGLWASQGRTPEASVYSALFMSLRRDGLLSPFIQTAPSTFGLRPVLRGMPLLSHPAAGQERRNQ